jgi:hypothetical protein
MDWQALILGLVAIVVGALVSAYGARGFFLLLPLWGFVAGFLLGAQLVAGLLGEGLLATVAGWAMGFVVGAGFALLASLWWWASIVILSGTVGYLVGSGLLAAIGLDPGLLTVAAGLALGAVFAVGAIALDVPTLLVAGLTALGGAAYVIGGAYLVLGQMTVEQLREGPLGALEGRPLALLGWLALAIVALGYQWLDMRRARFEAFSRAGLLRG